MKEVIPVKKRIYRARNIKSLDIETMAKELCEGGVFGVDAAKDDWVGALMRTDGTVVATVKWKLVEDHVAAVGLLEELRAAGVELPVVVEPTGTYADPWAHQLHEAGFAVYQVSPKHSHDYSEIYDGVPSSHDGKSAAIVGKLHLEGKSRAWKPRTAGRRTLRAKCAMRDWVGQDIKRYEARLEARWARHWPELSRILDFQTKTARVLAATYGDPAALIADEEAARETIRRASRGRLATAKVDAVIESARRTIGVPAEPAETDCIRMLGETLTQLYAQLKSVSEAVEIASAEEPAAASLAPVIGKETAAVVVAYVGAPTDYDSVRGYQRAFGMNLREHSSGKKKGKLALTKRGSAVARRWMFLAALRWTKEPIVRAWFHAKAASSGSKMKALIAVMRKLIAALYHVGRGQPLKLPKLFDVRRLDVAA